MIHRHHLLLASVLILASFTVVFASETAKSDAALELLKAGNKRFTDSQTIHPNQNAARRSETTTGGQHPIASILSCSDSRVVPEILFDQGIGDVFIIRVAGNVADGDEIGSIEYGVGHLKTPLFVVLGHTSCGAVTAVVMGAEVHGSIPALVDNIVPAAKRAGAANPKNFGAELVPAAIRENVWVSIEDVFNRSSEVRELVEKGELMVVGGIYNIESGNVEWLGKHPNQFKILEEANLKPAAGHGEKKAHEEKAPAKKAHGEKH